jgi:hypothetical protein
VHGAETVEQEVSSYSIAHEIAETSRGMMMAIPADAWRVFRTMSAAAMGGTLLDLAGTVRLRTVRTTPRGPKKPRPKREENAKRSPVSTAKLLIERKANVVTP